MIKKILFIGCLNLTLFWVAELVALAESPFLKQGIEAYKAGDYTSAAGHFGAAQSAEFSNPLLHYYLANTLVHLNQRESAIREYRIAFALDPEGEIGKKSKLALASYDAESTSTANLHNSKSTSVNDALGKITFSSDPVIQQAVAAMQKQVGQLTAQYSNKAQSQASSASKRGDEASQLIKKITQQDIDDMNTFPGHLSSGARQSIAKDMTDEANSKADAIKKIYESQKAQIIKDNTKGTTVINESANNLQQLLNEKSSNSKIRLNPAGTNLYVRNYIYVDTKSAQKTGGQPNKKTPNKSNSKVAQ